MNLLVCGYRDWAKEVIRNLSSNEKIKVFESIDDHKKLLEKFSKPQNFDVILFIGWSWIIPKNITDQYLCIGIHPSDLPDFRGGSPIQNQIINGITKSKVSLFTLASKIDSGEIWLKDDLSLQGDDMNSIFNKIIKSSTNLLNDFIERYPDIQSSTQNLTEGSYFKRRKPEQSKLTKNDLEKMSVKSLYNFIRCLTDPYPNAYFEDDKGDKVFFKEVSFIEKSKKND